MIFCKKEVVNFLFVVNARTNNIYVMQLQNLYRVMFFLQLYQVALRNNAGSSKDKQ